jgi:hypothetical protein
VGLSLEHYSSSNMIDLRANLGASQDKRMKVFSGGWPRLEADHRFLLPAVPATIGDPQTARALLGFFKRVEKVEHNPSSSSGWFSTLSQISISVWIAKVIG